MDIAEIDPPIYGGGLQDNGTTVTFYDDPDDFLEILGGDGGWLALDPHYPFEHIYANYQNMALNRFADGKWKNVSPQEEDRHKPWMAITAMDPSDPNTVYICSNAVWKTTDDAASWSRVSGRFDGSTITAFEVCYSDPDRLYVGTENGSVFRSEDGGATWSNNLANTVLPGFSVTHIKSDPTDADRIFLTTANFGARHVFRSEDGGDDWTDIDRGNLPDVPHSAIAIPRSSPRTIYVGNDLGVFVSTNAGGNWRNLTGDLPNSPVIDLAFHESGNTLYAATYGRSIWKLSL